MATRILLAAALLVALFAPPADAIELSLEPPAVAVTGTPLTLDVAVEGLESGTLPARVSVDGREVARVDLVPGPQSLSLDVSFGAGRRAIEVTAELAPEVAGGEPAAVRAGGEVRAIPGWLSIVPPLVAIGLALLFKDVVVALFAGIFIGALALADWNPFRAVASSLTDFMAPALADPDRAKIIVFSMMLGGMVGVISKSGGSHGIVERLVPYATTERRGQLATWAMGLLIFFDDYANTLIVGSTMRPLTDRLKISREKLAYIVDSTAAPVVTIIPISTWVGFEVGLLDTAFKNVGLPLEAYPTFVRSIPYHFYPILALMLGFCIAYFCRDFGPMYRAEMRSSREGKVIADGDTPLADYAASDLAPADGIVHRAVNALAPILTVIVMTVISLYHTGAADLSRADYPGLFDWLRAVFSASDPYNALIWASFSGLLVAIVLPMLQRLLSLRQSVEAMINGIKSMLLAMIVLVLAWSVAGVCDALHTADWVVGATEGVLSPRALPALVFVISAAVAFSTGTSWGSMGILVPLVIPICHGLATGSGLAVADPLYQSILLGSIASVLAGSVWGDHCSPISDTTILSSMASGCDHVAHVRTQLPYAASLGLLGLLVGNIPIAFGVSPFVSLLVAAVVIVLVVRFVFKPSA